MRLISTLQARARNFTQSKQQRKMITNNSTINERCCITVVISSLWRSLLQMLLHKQHITF